MDDRRLRALLSAYREPAIDRTRLATLGDRLAADLRRRAPRPWWRQPTAWAVAAGLALVALSAAWSLRPLPTPPATLAGQPLQPGVPVTVSGSQVLAWADGTRLALDDGAEIALVDNGAGSKEVRLARGVLSAEIAPQPAGRPLRLATPHTAITVRGTAFTVEADDGASRIAVSHGAIELAPLAGGPPTAVAAGEVAVAAARGATTARPQAALPVRNPGFEQPLVDDAYHGWFMDVRNNDSTARLVQDVRHGGRQSLLLEQYNPIRWPAGLAEVPDYQTFINAPQGGRGHVSVSQRFAVLAGHDYRLSFAWRSRGLSPEQRAIGPDRGLVKFAACLFWHRADGQRTSPSQEVLPTFTDAPEWTMWPPAERPDLGKHTAPPDATEGVISFKLSTAVEGRTAQVWIDGVEFGCE